MEIFYSSRKQEKILTNPRLVKKEYNELSNKILIRITELKSVICLEDIPVVPPPRRHKLSNDLDNRWAVDLNGKMRLVFEACGNYDINDLKTIGAIKIIDIMNYHNT